MTRRGESVLPDLKRAATASSDLEIRRRAVFLIEDINNRVCRPVRRFGTAIWCVRFSPNGRKAAASGVWGTVWIWEVETDRDVAILQHKESVTSIAFAPDGRSLVTGSHDGIVRLWDLSTKKVSHSFLDIESTSPVSPFLRMANKSYRVARMRASDCGTSIRAGSCAATMFIAFASRPQTIHWTARGFSLPDGMRAHESARGMMARNCASSRATTAD